MRERNRGTNEKGVPANLAEGRNAGETNPAAERCVHGKQAEKRGRSVVDFNRMRTKDDGAHQQQHGYARNEGS